MKAIKGLSLRLSWLFFMKRSRNMHEHHLCLRRGQDQTAVVLLIVVWSLAFTHMCCGWGFNPATSVFSLILYLNQRFITAVLSCAVCSVCLSKSPQKHTQTDAQLHFAQIWSTYGFTPCHSHRDNHVANPLHTHYRNHLECATRWFPFNDCKSKKWQKVIEIKHMM